MNLNSLLLAPRSNIKLTVDFLRHWHDGSPIKPVLFIEGPTGIGKTTMLRLIAEKVKATMVEYGPNMSRTPDDITRILNESMSATTGSMRIILFEGCETFKSKHWKIIAEAAKNSTVCLVCEATGIIGCPKPIAKNSLFLSFLRPNRKMLGRMTKDETIIKCAKNPRDVEMMSFQAELAPDVFDVHETVHRPRKGTVWEVFAQCRDRMTMRQQIEILSLLEATKHTPGLSDMLMETMWLV